MDTKRGIHSVKLNGPRIERFLSFAAFVVGGVLVLIVSNFGYRSVSNLALAGDQMSHALLVRQEAETALSLVADAEAGHLGFLLTGDPDDLKPYDAAVQSLPSHMARLGELTRNDAAEQTDLWRFNALAASRLAKMDEAIRARREQGLPAALEIVQSGRSEQLRSDARSLISSILEREIQLDKGRQGGFAREVPKTAFLFFGGMGFAVALIVGAGLLLSRANRRRDWEQFGQATFWNLLELRSGSLPRGSRPARRPTPRSNVGHESATSKTGAGNIAAVL